MDNNNINTGEQRGATNPIPEPSFDLRNLEPNQTSLTPEMENDNGDRQREKKPNFAPPVPPITSSVSDDNDDTDDTDIQSKTASTGTIEEQNPEIAVDGEKLEKEWVAKTEQVIKQTENNPKEEEIETNELKADYMAKRFNRHLGDRNK